MNDMKQAIIPKSDQLNADDLISGPITVKITGVTIKPGEQPVAISFEGDNGKPYKACKSMCRVMVTAWGPDSKKYVGRSMTLYRDPAVKWGGMEVGGIRISHMSDIDSAITMALTVTRANKKPFTVKPMGAKPAPSTSAAPPTEQREPSPSPAAGGAVAGAPSDADLVEDIAVQVKRKNFDAAYDLARSIVDEPLRASTEERINKAMAYVQAAAAK